MHLAPIFLALAHAGARRTAAAPEVPTFKELGYASLVQPGWYGIFAAAGMKPDVVGRLNEIFVAAMRTPAVRERIARLEWRSRS